MSTETHTACSALLSQFYNKAACRPRYPCAFRRPKHLTLESQISKISLCQSAQFCSSLTINQLTQINSLELLDFCISPHYSILNSTAPLPIPSHPTPGHAEEHQPSSSFSHHAPTAPAAAQTEGAGISRSLGVVGRSLLTMQESTISNHPSYFNRERRLKCYRSHQLEQKAPVLSTKCCLLPVFFSSRPEDGANSSFLLGAPSCAIYTSMSPSTTAFQF